MIVTARGFGLLLVALLHLPASAGQNRLLALNVQPGDDGTTVELRFAHPPEPDAIHAFSTLEPPRLVLDFPQASLAGDVTRNTPARGLASRAVLATDHERLRLQLDLRRAVTHRLRVDGNTLRVELREPAPPPNEDTGLAVSAIDFRRGAAGEGRLTVELPTAQAAVTVRQLGQKLVADIAGVDLPAALQRRMEVNDFATPVTRYAAMRHEGGTRLVIEPQGMWRYHAYQSGQQLLIDVIPVTPPAHRIAGDEYRGAKLSLNFQDIEVRSALQVLADFTGLNVIASDAVAGRLSLRLKDVPWDQALDIIMQARGLDMRRNGNIVWIAPREEMLARQRQELEQKASIADLEPLQAEVFQLNYQRADTFRHVFGIGDDGAVVAERRNALLSRRGSAVVDARTNQLFVTDTMAVLANIRKLLERIDIAARQVLIEARIVEADDSFARNLGMRLGLSAKTRGAAAGNSYAGVGELSGQTPPAPGTYLKDSALNLPAPAIAGAHPGSFAFTLFNAAAQRFLNVELSALESEGRGKIVSSPRVVTADQQAALIEQGEEIPYQQSTSSGATATAFKKANLKLEVTPQITPDGNVILDVDVNKDSRGSATPGGLAINTKHVKTRVQVEDGGTVVIGGIYTQTENRHESRVPFLGDIPLLGHLFRQSGRVQDKTELLIFLTPRVVMPPAAY
ncbi:type IV pilus secretin PilQ [Herbaspirillum sp. WKF16]|uniref:type IV pilus secretin PilQ n=1 Tax=Herbaspirillum sp. WKF16 TaxID=3028312 RepID=UPI0023A96BAD|nr:type IV pilus secretin PilQ [Herbaspirillum sp. WKF16]WDZ95559.1 type IV pilus secretin PilQ [Herbaspirillum sp. WKF16]